MKHPILLEFDTNIEISDGKLADQVFHAVRLAIPELSNVTVSYSEGLRQAVAELLPPTPPAPTASTAPTTPADILGAVIEGARSLLSEQSEPDAQSEQYEHDLAAYERLLSLLAAATTHDPSITALSRAALTAGLF